MLTWKSFLAAFGAATVAPMLVVVAVIAVEAALDPYGHVRPGWAGAAQSIVALAIIAWSASGAIVTLCGIPAFLLLRLLNCRSVGAFAFGGFVAIALPRVFLSILVARPGFHELPQTLYEAVELGALGGIGGASAWMALRRARVL